MPSDDHERFAPDQFTNDRGAKKPRTAGYARALRTAGDTDAAQAREREYRPIVENTYYPPGSTLCDFPSRAKEGEKAPILTLDSRFRDTIGRNLIESNAGFEPPASKGGASGAPGRFHLPPVHRCGSTPCLHQLFEGFIMNAKCWKASLGLALLFGVGSANAGPPLLPRTPFAKQSVPLSGLAASQYVVSVKFVDAEEVRISSGSLVTATTPSEATAIASVLSLHGLALEPEIDLPALVLQDIIDEAEARSGRAQPDWFGTYRIIFPSSLEAARQSAVNALLALSSVEYLSLAITETPPPTPTPAFDYLQSYFSSSAIDVDYAKSLGFYGQGMTYVGVEYCWLLDHEDLDWYTPDLEAGITPNSSIPQSWCWHGTATTGMLSANIYNGFGVNGMTPLAIPHVNTEWSTEGPRRPAAILSGISRSNVGDVIMLEMQTSWPSDPNYGPAEFDPLVWNASRTAFDAGRLVVAAAGNGGRNLDDPMYASYLARGDSGAIIVGAGVPSTRERLGFSTYGSRVNLQGWGSNVATLGYGDLFHGDGNYNRSYTSAFSGTSSATPIVTAATLLTQQAVKAKYWVPFDAIEMRKLLQATGKPQGASTASSSPIGPLPDLLGSLSSLDTADAGVSAVSGTQPKVVRLEITNHGPSRVVGRSVTVQLSINDVYANVQRTDTSGIFCQGSGSCFGTCLIYECQLPDLRFGAEPITLEWSCDGARYNPTLTTIVVLDNGKQIDPVSSNDELVHYSSCMPTE